MGTKTLFWGPKHYFGDKNIILGAETLLWGPKHYYGDKNIILGTETLFWGPKHYFRHKTFVNPQLEKNVMNRSILIMNRQG